MKCGISRKGLTLMGQAHLPVWFNRHTLGTTAVQEPFHHYALKDSQPLFTKQNSVIVLIVYLHIY